MKIWLQSNILVFILQKDTKVTWLHRCLKRTLLQLKIFQLKINVNSCCFKTSSSPFFLNFLGHLVLAQVVVALVGCSARWLKRLRGPEGVRSKVGLLASQTHVHTWPKSRLSQVFNLWIDGLQNWSPRVCELLKKWKKLKNGFKNWVGFDCGRCGISHKIGRR